MFRIGFIVLVVAVAVAGWLVFRQQAQLAASTAALERAQARHAEVMATQARAPVASPLPLPPPPLPAPLPARGVSIVAPVSIPSPPGVVDEPARGGFACDGRTHCSQMHSCAEAKYFLAHCPGVKMDGNHDGEPCEQQFPECGR